MLYEFGVASPRRCTFNHRYKYAYFSVAWAAVFGDPNLPGREKAALEQCTAFGMKVQLRNPERIIKIEEVSTGTLLYQGPVTALLAHSGAYTQPIQQVFNGSCGNGTFHNVAGVEIPYSQYCQTDFTASNYDENGSFDPNRAWFDPCLYKPGNTTSTNTISQSTYFFELDFSKLLLG